MITKIIHQYLSVLLLLLLATATLASPDTERFNQLKFIGKNTKWLLCNKPLDIPERPQADAGSLADDIYFSSEEVESVEGISVFKGNVIVSKGLQQSKSDILYFDENENTANLQNNVQYWDEKLYLKSDSALLHFDNDTRLFKNANFIIKENRIYGQADTLFTQIDRRRNLKNVKYSTCGNNWETNVWQMYTTDLILDHEEEWGQAKNAVLYIKKIPIFYTPYLSFPLSSKRKTGFLKWAIGSSKRNGFEFQTPFYWNVSPQMDATLTPRLLEKNGIMLTGQFRYLSESFKGEINGQFLADDQESGEQNRYFLNFQHRQEISKRTSASFLYNRVSDQRYFNDFSKTRGLTSDNFLQQRANVSYRGNWWDANIKLQNYQVVNSTINTEPYKRLPQITLNARYGSGPRQLNFRFKNQLTYFDRDRPSNSPTGTRIDLWPSVSYPIRNIAAFLVPSFGLRYTHYSLENTGTSPANLDRLLPLLSLDSGIFLERATVFLGNHYIHTLEPRIYYLYIPETDQSELPIFDTGMYSFSFASLFRDGRFSGPDRVGDENRVTLALTSRFLDANNQREKGHISIGQTYYLADRKVTLPGGKQLSSTSSPIIAELVAKPLEHWQLRGDFQWDPDSSIIDRVLAQLKYSVATDRFINLNYRSRRNSARVQACDLQNIADCNLTLADLRNIEQTDIYFNWAITQNWSLVGRWNYAIPSGSSLEVIGGLKYDSCCWGFSIVAQRYLTDIDGEFDTAFFVQLDLKGLVGTGNDVQRFLTRKIPGYQHD